MTQPDLFDNPIYGRTKDEREEWCQFGWWYRSKFFKPSGELDEDVRQKWFKFWKWLHTPAGREIANKAIKATHALRKVGFKRYGIQAIIEPIRHEHDLKHGPDTDGYKINHNWRSFLARYIMASDDDLADFFETREPKIP